MSLKWKGNPKQIIESGLREAMREHIALAVDGAVELGEKILKDAKALAPIKTGKLRKSGKLYPNRRRLRPGRKMPTYHRIKIRFGTKRRAGKRSKRAADYAAIVHFDSNARHTTGTDQFLWIAVQRHASRLPAVIGRHWNARARRFEAARWKIR